MTWDGGLEPTLAQGADMTLVIAAQCSDGAIMCADTRECDMATGRYREGRAKIFKLSSGVLAGCAGSVPWAEDWINGAKKLPGANFIMARSAAISLHERTKTYPFPPIAEWLIMQSRPVFEVWHIRWVGSHLQPSFVSPEKFLAPRATCGFDLARAVADEHMRAKPPSDMTGVQCRVDFEKLMQHIASLSYLVGSATMGAFISNTDAAKDFGP